MTEEQIEAKKKYVGEKKASMKRRDDYHDYTERRMYMITLEVEGRKPLFGHLVGNPFAERGSEDEPRIELTPLGKAVQSEWMGIHGYFPQIEVKAVQMMPDHMHGILFVQAPLPVHLGQVISGFKAGCRKAQKALEIMAAAEPQPTAKETNEASKEATAKETNEAPKEVASKETSRTAKDGSPKPISEAAKEVAAKETSEARKKALTNNLPSSPQVTAQPSPSSSPVAHPFPAPSSPASHPYRPLFAKGYNDLILRSYEELPVWQNYLRDNPRRLMMKRLRPEWLRPFFGFRIGSQVYSGIGNRELLTACKRTAVRVSRRLTDSEIEAEVVRYLTMAKEGTVLVSPAISPGEKRVMRTVFDAGLPTIVILENGFTPLSKPRGEQFYACAKGQLLMLSPWDHHNEKKKLTAEQCQQMNLMALELCE